MEFKNIIIAEKLSKANWPNGAYTLCFVYSNKGNILIKGYLGDVDLEIKKLKAKGYKFFYNLLMFGGGQSRNYWSFYKDGVYIDEPYRPKRGDRNHHYIFKTFHHGPNDEKFEIKFKRLPKRWVKELDNL